MIFNYTLRSDPSPVLDVGFIRTEIILLCKIFAILYPRQPGPIFYYIRRKKQVRLRTYPQIKVKFTPKTGHDGLEGD